jgi:hypothetical protein
VNKLVIARVGLAPPVTEICLLESNSVGVNSLTKTFTFRQKRGTVVDDFRLFYPGLSILGKYFLVTNKPMDDG